jgi:hypothetical protein
MVKFTASLAIVNSSAKDEVAGLVLTETFLLCGRAAQKTHSGNVVFFHLLIDIEVASGKLSMAYGEA